tara:strand:+ start:699 stop:1112 length:414 start_codon:yes stop_codon:yes gene_type:complete
MRSEKKLIRHFETFEDNYEFSIFNFLVYGWFGGIFCFLMGIILSPVFFMKYSINCLSFKKGGNYTKRKIYLLFRRGLGFIDRGSLYSTRKKNKLLSFTWQILFIVSIVGIPFWFIWKIHDQFFKSWESGSSDTDDGS